LQQAAQVIISKKTRSKSTQTGIFAGLIGGLIGYITQPNTKNMITLTIF